jgi:hypothetical protein
LRSSGRLYLCDAHLEELAQHLEDVASEFRQFIQKKNPMMRQGHFSRHRQLSAADQPHIRNRVMGGNTGMWSRIRCGHRCGR